MKHALRAGTLPDPEPGHDVGFGLYLHWPFCQAKCPYCDFNSHVAREVDQERWAAAFEREIARAGAVTGKRKLDSVFFGGGTPSLMLPEIVDRILVAVRRTWSFSSATEVTLEANPTSVEAGRFRGFIEAGVNRFSIGVQALDDRDLRLLGRMHSVREALAAIEIARSLTDRVSFDLIYARQHQTRGLWQDELAQALSLAPEHLSLYQLTIEDGTVFGVRSKAGKLPGLPDDDLAADLYQITQELCDTAGLPAYEISNHARRGGESRHNLVYWRAGDYLGLGPGAHGRLTLPAGRYATRAASHPAAWLAAVEAGCGAHEVSEALTTEEQAEEYLMMALRLREGARMSRYEALAGREISAVVLNGLKSDRLMWEDGDRFGVTPQGRVILNAILRELM